MIIDKKSKKVVSNNQASANAKKEEAAPVEKPEQIEANGAIAIIDAFKEMLRSVTWEYGVAGSPKIFKTVQYDDGQYQRIVRKTGGNLEEGIAFPAAFVHMVDVHWNVTAQRFNDGLATLRIRFILNRLNTHDDGHDTDVYYVAERINQTVLEQKSNYDCLAKRCVLQYVDPMESFDNSLQPCWMTYDIRFTTTNIWVTRNKTYKRLVAPPFTNHADQNEESRSQTDHTNLSHADETYDKHTGFES